MCETFFSCLILYQAGLSGSGSGQDLMIMALQSSHLWTVIIERHLISEAIIESHTGVSYCTLDVWLFHASACESQVVWSVGPSYLQTHPLEICISTWKQLQLQMLLKMEWRWEQINLNIVCWGLYSVSTVTSLLHMSSWNLVQAKTMATVPTVSLSERRLLGTRQLTHRVAGVQLQGLSFSDASQIS